MAQLTTLRLRDIDPHTVALETCTRLLDHVALLLWQVSPIEAKTPGISELVGCQLYHAVRDLAQYAVRGGELDAPVQEYLASLIPLYSAAEGEGTREVDDLIESEPATSIGIVIAAAVAREALADGRAVTPAQLATLGGVDRDYLLRLAAAGDLPGARQSTGGRKPWTVTAEGALQWLAGRG